ncbi:MAG: HAMP domain-containing histidine kinase [Cytophagales bacterium]|nr:HAMP domain-containing histidine kinase [Cytophagales bacterium]
MAQQKVNEINEELRKLNTSLERKIEERALMFQKANEELDIFLYRSSHDLKSPVTSLLGLVNVAQMSVKDTLSLELFGQVDTTAKRMQRLISKLVRIHDINEAYPDYALINLRTLVDKLRAPHEKVITEQQIDFRARYNDLTVVNGNQVLLSIILEAIVDNALIFRKSHGVVPFVELEFKQEGEYLMIQCVDNGMGMEPEVRDRAFDMFYMGSELSKGNGLGLYLVRKAVEKLEGRIVLKSEAQKFTHLEIHVPVRSRIKSQFMV